MMEYGDEPEDLDSPFVEMEEEEIAAQFVPNLGESQDYFKQLFGEDVSNTLVDGASFLHTLQKKS